SPMPSSIPRCGMGESYPLDASRPGPGVSRGPRSGPAGSRAVRRFAKHRMAVGGAALLAVVGLTAICAPVSATFRYDRQDLFAIPFHLLAALLQTSFTAYLPTIRHGPLVWLRVLDADTGGVTALVMALALVGWLDVARVARGQVLSLRHREFVLAAKSLGAVD